jgi:Tfp pilus assembly protein PilN
MRAVNLIPAEQRGGAPVGAGQSEGAAYGLLGLLAGLAVLALLYGIAHHQIAARKAQAASVTAQAQQAQSAAQSLAPYTSFIAMREARQQAVATLINSRFDWAHVFHEFGRVLPAGISISSLEGTVGLGTPTAPAAAPAAPAAPAAAAGAPSAVASATPPGSLPTFTLSGCATSQREVALMLARLRLMDGVSNVTLQSSTKGASSGSGGASGGCPENAPVFTAQIAFDPLPASAAKIASTATVAQTTASGTGATAPSTSGVTAR